MKRLLLLTGFFAFACSIAFSQSAGQSAQDMDDAQVAPQENSCARYLIDTRAPERHHTFMPQQAFFTVGPQGTEVLVPANAFVHQDGSPVDAPIELRFTEVTDKHDMVLHNLPTNSNGRMLISGGVVDLQAYSEGKKLKLAEGKSVLVNFPMGYVEGMELFKGRFDQAGQLNWEPLAEAPQHLDKPRSGWKTTPEGGLPTFMDWGKVNSNTQKFEANGFHAADFMKEILSQQYRCAGPDDVQLKLELDGNGRVVQAQSLTGGSLCARLALEELSQTLVFDNTEPKTIVMQVKIVSALKHREGENEFASIAGRGEAFFRDPKLMEVLQRNLNAEKAKRFAQEAFELSEMGLINCDKFANEGQGTLVEAQLSGAAKPSNTKVFMVFDDLNSAVEGRHAGDGKYAFEQVPSGKKAKIIAICYNESDGPSAGTVNLTLGDQGKVNVDLKKVSEAELKATIAQL